MANVVKLYYVGRTNATEWELLPNKLFHVEDIASYLADKTALTISNFQYVKNKLELSINIDIYQSYSQPKAELSFKYVSIQNDNENIHYYFVKNVEWRSKSCVRFELIMDVINTFNEGSDYVFKANTRITREHKDRFKIGAYSIKLTFTSIISSAGTLLSNDLISLSRGGSLIPKYLGRVADKSLTYIIINFITFNFSLEDFETYIGDYANDIAIRKDFDNYIRISGVEIAETTNKYIRLIDYINENINPVLVHSSSKLLENTKTLLAQNRYLLYRNQNDPSESLVNPVECYLIPENETSVDSGVITSGRLTASVLSEGKYYYGLIKEVIGYDINSQSITLPDGTIYDGSTLSGYTGFYAEITKNEGNTLNVAFKWFKTGTYPTPDENGVYETIYYNLPYIQLDTLPFKYYESDTQLYGDELYPQAQYWTDEWDDTETGNKLYSINKLNKTDAKNIKLIKLPYAPYDFIIESNQIAISNDTKWEYTNFTQSDNIQFYALKLKDLNTKLVNYLSQSDSPFDNLQISFPASASINDLRITSVETESKMFHSEFYRPTYVYDSFQFSFQLEKLQVNNYVDQENLETSIRFDMTSTINSKFMFSFENLYYDKAEQNYYNVMPIARNNEEVLYNVPYINYIRTGYNYDVKNKNISNTSNAIGLGLSMASIGASLLVPSVPLKVAGIIASLVSVATSVKNTIVSAVNNENSLKQKLISTQNQATSVAGSDDVDLMSVYAKNRLSYMEYTPIPLMANLLKDLFFYAGYNSGKMGIPTHNNRINFDYLECEASLEKVSSIPDDCLTELINCFKSGITYLHKTARVIDKWDFNQKYENWEAFLFEED